MKFRIFRIIATALAGSLIISLAFSGCGKKNAEEVEASKWDNLAEEQLTKNLDRYFSSGVLPEGNEKAFLVWAFKNNAEKVEEYSRKYAQGVSNLPWYMSDGAWDMVKEGDVENGLKMLTLAQELFPNDPDVLGITGIITYLRGDSDNARKFLEEAESWRANRPIVDFYLGGLLVSSESAADRARGKAILMKLVGGNDAELRELSGLTLLTNPGVPMIVEDLDLIYASLVEDSVFRADNPNLPVEALRVIINKLARQRPEEAMKLADLLLGNPNVNVEDMIGIIRLGQALKLTEKSGDLLNQLEQNDAFMKLLEEDNRLEELGAIQDFMEESHESGMESLRVIVASPESDAVVLQRSFKTILNNELPISVEGELLKLYLEMPVFHVPTSLNILSRLIQVEPLESETWVAYAIEELLAKDFVRVGGWLTGVDASGAIIKALSTRDTQLTPNEALILINAYISDEKLEQAEVALQESKGLIEPIMDSYFMAQILAGKGEKEEAFVYWKEAQQAVLGSNRFPLMKNLGILALQLDQPVNAMQTLYTAFSAGIPFTQAQAGELIQLTLQYGNLRQAISIADYLAQQFPDSPVHINNLSYFKFLTEEQVEESVEAMRKVVDDYPELNQFRLTLALGLVKAGRTNEANRLLKSTDIDWDKTSTRGLLIYAVVLAASGQESVAEGLLQNLDLEVLIPEEKALLEAF
jgi:tetratricopeptide (TPR) repeat protein